MAALKATALIVVNWLAWFERLRDLGKQNWRLRIDGDQCETARPIVFVGAGLIR